MTTIEFRHADSRKGLVLEIGDASLAQAEECIRSAAFMASGFERERRMVTSPGWWCALTCSAALHMRLTAVVQRVVSYHDLHVIVITERGRMLEQWPTWPRICLPRTKGKRPKIFMDLRPEPILSEGPSDADLAAYAARVSMPSTAASLADLRRSFDMGVLEFSNIRDANGRWVVDIAT